MQSPDEVGSYVEQQFSAFRTPTIDTLAWGRKRHHIPILLEVDVTAARAAVHTERAKTGQGVSFMGWLVKCLAQAVNEHKSIQSLRKGDRRVVIFDDVDVTMIVERAVGEAGTDQKLPMPYIIRKANVKSVAEISAEIRAAQQQPLFRGEFQIASKQAGWVTHLATMLPRFVRDLFFWQRLFRDPFLFKRTMGTVALTAMGMVGHGISWGIPIGIHPLIVAVGALVKRPGIVDEQILIREYVGLTVLFDHDVTDGAPVARFINRFQELMSQEYGLSETQTT